MSTLASRISNRRKELSMTQEELAKKLGYKTKSTICRIETGDNDIPLNKVDAFAEALQTSRAYIMGWEDEEPAVPLHPDIKEAEEKPSARQVMIATIDKLSDSEKTHWTALMREYLQSKQGNH